MKVHSFICQIIPLEVGLKTKSKNPLLKNSRHSRFQTLMIFLIICFDDSHGVVIFLQIACSLENINYSLQNMYYETA